MANFKFPNNVTQFNTYLTAFHKTFNAHYRTYGFSQSDVRVFNQFYKSWQQNYAMYTQFSAMNDFFTKFWNNEYSNFQSYFSWVFAQIQKNKNFNGNGQYWFGNTAVKSVPSIKSTAKKSTSKKTTAKKATTSTTSISSTVSKPAAKVASKTTSKSKSTTSRSTTPVRSTSTARKTVSKKSTTVRSSSSNSSVLKSAPIVWFTSTKKGQVNVWVGSTKNGTFKLPEGASAAYVEYRYEGGAWTRLTQGAKFPFIHSLNSSKKVYYRACWVGSNNTKGVFSTTVSWNNTAKAA
ncbi:MAG: hypothetical protein HONBIEJF_01192 [Fimbriimonadaceae bacterium]|nr:hypothetical protein [Fimbriimonadaceae bacterium]